MRRWVSTDDGRGTLSGALGGLLLATMFALLDRDVAHPGDLARYALRTGSPLLGFLVVLLIGTLIGLLYGRFLVERAHGSAGALLGYGLLCGLAWFVLSAWILLPLLGAGPGPFALSVKVMNQLIPSLVYGLVLGTTFDVLRALH